MPDPLDVLHLPDEPVRPDPDFAAALRARLIDILLHPTREADMSTDLTTPTAPPRNGRRHGDISYLTFLVRDAARARAFYGPLLGWTFEPDGPAPRSSVAGVRPEMGLAQVPDDPSLVLAYRVDDIAAAVERIRRLGGTATEPVQRPYALEADCTDPHGVPFYLHEFEDGPTQAGGDGPHEGDVGYLSLGVADLSDAQAFYGAVLGWRFSPGDNPQGVQVEGVAPMTGLWGGGWLGARPSYRVDDIHDAVAKVRALGGTAGPVDTRPYGLACDDCVDDQGAPFMLLQLA